LAIEWARKSRKGWKRVTPQDSAAGTGDAGGAGLEKLAHIVVIVLENWSYDSLYGDFPGAEGLAKAQDASPQIDATGTPYQTLPQTETHLPQTLPNAPFALR